MPPAGRQVSPARSTVSNDGDGVPAGGPRAGQEALARDLPRAAPARDGRLALLPLPEPRRPLHAVALSRPPAAVVASPGPGLRGRERDGALGGAADRATHAELVRRGDVAARRQRRGQHRPRRGGHLRGFRLPAARARGGSTRQRGRRAGVRLDREHDHDPGLPGARPARDTRRPAGADAGCSRPPTSARARSCSWSSPGSQRSSGTGRCSWSGARSTPSSGCSPASATRTAPASGSSHSATGYSMRSARGGRSPSARSSPSRDSTISGSSAVSPRSAPGRIRRSSSSPTPAGCCSR